MITQYSCQLPRRVAVLRKALDEHGQPLLNGIYFLEVDQSQTTLYVTFVHNLGAIPVLNRNNIEVVGGVRTVNPKVLSVNKSVAQPNQLVVVVDTPGDYSSYRLRLVKSSATGEPPDGIDPALSEVEFSFKVDCPSDFDCLVTDECPSEQAIQPAIDYLAKDYSSFRRLMLDRLSVLMPGQTERNPADLWVTLCELVAYRADELSYYQDAVATEAYLGTARKRTSVRRHARLLDYPFHEGCNARVWIALEVGTAGDGQRLPGPVSGMGGTLLMTAVRGEATGKAISETAALRGRSEGALVFEALHDVRVYEAHNKIKFYTWSAEECCLPKGATRAYLYGDGLKLQVGDVLVLIEAKSPDNAEEADADPGRRHAVRLTYALPGRDPLTKKTYLEVQWSAEDALPFPFCISKRFSGELNKFVTDMSVALGNVVLADQGLTLANEKIEAPVANRIYRPLLSKGPLTQQGHVRQRKSGIAVLFDQDAPAVHAMRWEMADVMPAVMLVDGRGDHWRAKKDLVSSDRFAGEFVAEIQEDGMSNLRFGDNANARMPRDGDSFSATYRIGKGSIGNVGANSIVHVVARPDMEWVNGGISNVFNPLAASGGIDPHAIEQAKLYAPQAFRHQERAVTTDDYARITERHPEVQRAVATRRWTGSWYTTFISVDRRGGQAVEAKFEDELRQFLDRYRLAGHDVEIDNPKFVSLDIALVVCVKAGYFAPDVKSALLKVFSSGNLPAGDSGFFHPDNFTFGQPVYLSQVIESAMNINGVMSVTPLRFQRLGRAAAMEIENGLIVMARLEIARAENNRNAPQNGRIDFEMQGGE